MKDFGDILDAWERQTAIPQGKKKRKKNNEISANMPAKSEDILIRWLEVNGVYDKDADEENESSSAERRRRVLNKKPDASIDLHKLTQDEAWEKLEEFFRESKQNNFEKILIVHGKGNHGGNAVLRQLTHQFIEKSPFAGESGHNPATLGGTGTTWVILK
jgi:DNA-nicking Smr family endonuclease